MTFKEHWVIVMMLVRQERYTLALTEILIDRGVLDKDDMKAFDALMLSNERQDPAIIRRVLAEYRAMMKGFGLDVPEQLFDKKP